MKKHFAKPQACPLYRLKHPALRQVGCPVCQSVLCHFTLKDTVVMDGPRKHPGLGPIVGEVFSVTGKCDKGHCFILRLANHRDRALLWTDVVVELNMESDKPVLGDYGIHGAAILEPMALDNPVGKDLDMLESLPEKAHPSNALGSDFFKSMQKHQPPAQPLGSKAGEDGHGPEDCETCNDVHCPSNPKYDESKSNRCHAGLPVLTVLEDVKAANFVPSECITCPNAVCPVQQHIMRLLIIRNRNVDSCYSLDPKVMPTSPHEDFKSILQAVYKKKGKPLVHPSKKPKPSTPASPVLPPSLPKGVGKPVPPKLSLAEASKTVEAAMPPHIKKALDAELAKQREANKLKPVPGCPDNLTHAQASSAKCQKAFCAPCVMTHCYMHPKNNPKV